MDDDGIYYITGDFITEILSLSKAGIMIKSDSFLNAIKCLPFKMSLLRFQLKALAH